MLAHFRLNVNILIFVVLELWITQVSLQSTFEWPTTHKGLSGFVCDTDWDFFNKASGRITSQIAISTAELGVCIVSLTLLLIIWKRDDKYKRAVYSTCEYASLVGVSSSYIGLFIWIVL